MEKSGAKIVLVYPTPLVITKQKNSNYFESKLNLSNLTNEYVIFKLYINQRSLYSAKPSTSFIKPKETAHVLIKRFAKDDNQSSAGKDRFLLYFYTINKIINDNEEAKEAFKSKIYNESSKQESMIYVVLKEQENEEFDITPQIDENNLEEIGADYTKGIQIYKDLNEKMRQESNLINQRIKELEKAISMIKNQQILKEDKEKAIIDRKAKTKNNQNYHKNIMLISLILLGLMIGANLANLFNKIFNNYKTN
jgi:tRNA/tmRNA/rRNA uracil-C5-methylase (TrmA/RlmC/RlmD family)